MSLAQVCDAHNGSPMQMKIQLTFGDQSTDATSGGGAIQSDSTRRGDVAGNERIHDAGIAMQIHVQLQDPLGGTLQEQAPTSEGLVRMTVCKKLIYRLRVTGPQIEETTLDNVQPGSGDSQVTIVLHRKLTKQERKLQKATVSAHGLNIPKKAQKQLDKGDEALKRGKLEEARKHYAKAAEIYPQFEEADNSLGVVLMQEGKKAEGRDAFARAVAVNHNYAPAQINLAKIAFDEKRYDDSYLLARQALRSEPLNPGGLFVAAESAFFKGEYADTVSLTRTLHSLPHAQYSLAHFLAGKSLEAEQQPQAAIVEYQTFLEEDPGDPNAQRAREIVTLLQASPVAADRSSPQ